MFEAEFTHEGDRCSFEVLLVPSRDGRSGARAIAEIVHDIDLKDEKFGREETSGIAHLVAGLSITHKGDEQRIERGAAVFDDLDRILPQETRLGGPRIGCVTIIRTPHRGGANEPSPLWARRVQGARPRECGR